jgi:hypothetical protein
MGRRDACEGQTFVAIDLFARWFAIFFCQKRPKDVGEAVLGAMEESFKVSLPNDGRVRCSMLQGGNGGRSDGCR